MGLKTNTVTAALFWPLGRWFARQFYQMRTLFTPKAAEERLHYRDGQKGGPYVAWSRVLASVASSRNLGPFGSSLYSGKLEKNVLSQPLTQHKEFVHQRRVLNKTKVKPIARFPLSLLSHFRVGMLPKSAQRGLPIRASWKFSISNNSIRPSFLFGRNRIFLTRFNGRQPSQSNLPPPPPASAGKGFTTLTIHRCQSKIKCRNPSATYHPTVRTPTLNQN